MYCTAQDGKKIAKGGARPGDVGEFNFSTEENEQKVKGVRQSTSRQKGVRWEPDSRAQAAED